MLSSMFDILWRAATQLLINKACHRPFSIPLTLNHVWLLLPSLRVTIREENLKKFDSLFAVGMERRGPVELRETIVGQKFFEI
ncbi:hypothetical protein HI914_04769 [Erysiphe necator]|nr:hypothetical protein HI914_04769 [Erysiphe necator]